jgi:hypothetical protein
MNCTGSWQTTSMASKGYAVSTVSIVQASFNIRPTLTDFKLS